MSNAIYPEFLAALSRAEIDATTVDWWLQPLDPDATFDPADTSLLDVTADAVGGGVQLTFDGLQVLDFPTAVRYLTPTAPYALADITSSDDVGACVVFADDGVDTFLAAWLDTRADSSAVAFVGTGEVVSMSFPGGWFIQL